MIQLLLLRSVKRKDTQSAPKSAKERQRAQRKRRITSHESRVTNNESRITNHESRITPVDPIPSLPLKAREGFAVEGRHLLGDLMELRDQRVGELRIVDMQRQAHQLA